MIADVRHMSAERPTDREAPRHKGKDDGIAFLFIAFGAYLLCGAYSAFANAKWPIFMPPQLDVFGFLFRIFGEPAGAYLGGALLVVLGVACCGAGIVAIVKDARA